MTTRLSYRDLMAEALRAVPEWAGPLRTTVTWYEKVNNPVLPDDAAPRASEYFMLSFVPELIQPLLDSRLEHKRVEFGLPDRDTPEARSILGRAFNFVERMMAEGDDRVHDVAVYYVVEFCMGDYEAARWTLPLLGPETLKFAQKHWPQVIKRAYAV